MFEQAFKNIDDVLWKELAALDALKESLLHQAFTGEL